MLVVGLVAFDAIEKALGRGCRVFCQHIVVAVLVRYDFCKTGQGLKYAETLVFGEQGPVFLVVNDAFACGEAPCID